MSPHPERTSRSPDPTLNVARSILAEAAQHPWLAALLMRRRPDWLTRLAELAVALRHLPRHVRRTLWRKLATGLAAAALLLALAGTPQTVYAASITVNGDGTGGTCSLAAAIDNANHDSQYGSTACEAGSGADTINLTANVTLSTALPSISSDITIQGNNHTISGNSTFSILTVSPDGALTLQNATISGGSRVDGGGIYNARGTVTVQNCTISGNAATNRGGGIYNAGTLTVRDSTISGNTAAGLSGGGIHTFYGTVTVRDSTIISNTSAQHGGGITNFGGTVTVQNSTISGNNAATEGGGIYNNFHGTMAVQNSTISGNSATSGGGIYNNFQGTMAVQNSIVAEQTSGADCRGVTSGGYNIESSTTCGFTSTTDLQNVLPGDLNLQALAQNGSNPHPFTHALGPGSVAIDRILPASGDPLCNDNGTSVDERGAVRAGGTNRGGTACDVGAYEVSDQTPSAVTTRDLMATVNAPVNAMGVLGGLLVALGGMWIALRRHLKRS